MPLQNRVTPFATIVALPGRGAMMGNRGVLHDEARRIVRAWQVRRWIACRTEFRGRHRVIMQPRAYTELFFLDEATAFAAGHRPCAECRYADYRRFVALWPQSHGGPVRAETIDALLHADRLAGRRQRTFVADIGALPDGTFISLGGAAVLVLKTRLLHWSNLGYTKRAARPPAGDVTVLTPRCIVAVLEAGYVPGIHPSADDVSTVLAPSHDRS